MTATASGCVLPGSAAPDPATTLNVAAYHFVSIADPAALAAQMRVCAEADDLRGTILIAAEGINLFLAGADAVLRRFVETVHADPRFAAMPVKFSRSAAAPFTRLKVKVKPEIISFRKDGVVPEAARAPAVSPATLARWIGQGADDDGRRLVLLDTRNRQEVVYGSFAGALTLPIDRFTELPDAVMGLADTLADATVVSFCTGGIRCEKSALWMRAQGMDNVLQLDGGILGYFEQVGGYGYDGRCFVFDERIALDPALEPLASVSPDPD